MALVAVILLGIYLGGKLDDITNKIEEVSKKKFK